MVNYLINGFDLHQPDEGFRLMESTQFASEISPRRVSLQVPRMHGEIPAWDDPIDSTGVVIRVRIQDSDPDMLERKWNHLRAHTLLGGNRAVILVRESELSNTSAQVQLESMSQPDFWCAAGIVDTTMVFHNPSGRWQESVPQDQLLLIPGTQQEVFAVSDSTAPITNALLRVQGPVSSVEVRNDANDTGLRWSSATAVTSGNYLLIDCENFEAWANTSNEWGARHTDVSRDLLSVGTAPLTLTPIPSVTFGSNTSSVTVSSTGTEENSELHIQARRTYA